MTKGLCVTSSPLQIPVEVCNRWVSPPQYFSDPPRYPPLVCVSPHMCVRMAGELRDQLQGGGGVLHKAPQNWGGSGKGLS